MRAAGNPADAAIQQRYHKSDQSFFGLKAAQQRAIVREVFPSRQPLSRDEHLPVIWQLWASSYFDERVAALLLLGRLAPLLGVDDLVELRSMTGDCQGAKSAKETPRGKELPPWAFVMARGVGTGTRPKACHGEAVGTPEESCAGAAPHCDAGNFAGGYGES